MNDYVLYHLPTTPMDILSFWLSDKSRPKWFANDPSFDAVVSARYGAVLRAAKLGELFQWRETMRGRLAEIIVLDKFSRNIHRGTATAFEGPKKMASAKTSTAVTKSATSALGRRQAHTAGAKPPGGKRSSPCLSDQVPCAGNRQDAAGNHRSMQKCPPKPCRCRHCPAQEGRPHPRARREALRHTVGRDRATRRALTPGQKASAARAPK
jgi:hypothetical protein